MKVFVTGATGFVGQEVLRQLHAAGHGIRILARNRETPRVREAAARQSAEVHPGNILDRSSLAGALAHCDAVVHLVGIISEVNEQTFANVHPRATGNMVNAAKQAGVRRFVHMSALGTRPDAVSRYHQSKWAAEEVVRHSGLDFTIFRPSLIFGPRDQFVNLFTRMARWSPVLPVMGGGKAKFAPVAVADVAACFVRALTEPAAANQTFDLCGPDQLTLPQILETILAVTGRKCRLARVPPGVARFQAVLLEWAFPRLLRRAPPLNRDQLLMLAEDNVGDPGPARKVFGFQPSGFRYGLVKFLKPDA